MTDLFKIAASQSNGSINGAATFLYGKVFCEKTDHELKEEDIVGVPDYKALLDSCEHYVIKRGKKHYRTSVFSPLGESTIRQLYYQFDYSDGNFTMPLEKLISLCTACNMDFGYISQAIEAFCPVLIKSKGLRHILMYGAAKGFIAFDEIGCMNIAGKYRTGLLEEYYGKAYASYASIEDISSLPSVDSGTKNCLTRIAECHSREDFFRLLDDPSIQQGFVCDLIESVRHAQDILEKRKLNDESENSLFRRYHAGSLRSHYSKFCRGKSVTDTWLLCLALAFRFTKEETDSVFHTRRLNPDQQNDLYDCMNKIHECSAVFDNPGEYKARLRELPGLKLPSGKTVSELGIDFGDFLCTFVAEAAE